MEVEKKNLIECIGDFLPDTGREEIDRPIRILKASAKTLARVGEKSGGFISDFIDEIVDIFVDDDNN